MDTYITQNLSWVICVFLDAEFHHPIRFASKVYYINHIVACVVNIIIIISTVLLNTGTIIAYWKSTQLRKKMSYFLVMLQSCADLTNGLFGNAGFVLMLVKDILHDSDCKANITVDLTSSCFVALSFVTLILLNIERYLTIVHPFYARNKVTKSRLLLAAVVLWSLAFAVTVPCKMFSQTISDYLSGITILVVIMASVYFYTAIYFASRRTAHGCRSEQEMRSEARKAQDIKLAKSCAIVVGCTFLCYTPYAIFCLPIFRSNVRWLVLYWAVTLGCASSSLNSLIFFWRNPVLRKEARNILIGNLRWK